MNGCEVQASGALELYFYDELDGTERASFEHHLRDCAACRQAVEELSLIRSALATRPVIDAPAGGDWGSFMVRLDDAIRFEDQTRALASAEPVAPGQAPAYMPYLALAAAAVLVTSSVVYFARTSAPRPAPAATVASHPQPSEVGEGVLVPRTVDSPETAFAALSEQHFERSKLVVLGLANKDAQSASEADWAYERGLASNLLSDTRVYRLAAEERGLKNLAGVMGDLEAVLLQTSLADTPNPAALAEIQRFIHKRDLVSKMEVAMHGS
jgi:Putative zinc-finger